MDPFSETLFAMIAVGSSAQLLELPKLKLITSQPFKGLINKTVED